MEPKLKALKYIKFVLDAIEELRHMSPEKTYVFDTHCGKLACPGIIGGDFNKILEKLTCARNRRYAPFTFI